VEVGDSSLRFDRERKVPLYAAAGIAEVWLVDLVEKSLTCHKFPVRGKYSEISQFKAGARIPIPKLDGATLNLTELVF
jgi:Uma2 family endonuclease